VTIQGVPRLSNQFFGNHFSGLVRLGSFRLKLSRAAGAGSAADWAGPSMIDGAPLLGDISSESVDAMCCRAAIENPWQYTSS
jgi:hypothetical protein